MSEKGNFTPQELRGAEEVDLSVAFEELPPERRVGLSPDSESRNRIPAPEAPSSGLQETADENTEAPDVQE